MGILARNEHRRHQAGEQRGENISKDEKRDTKMQKDTVASFIHRPDTLSGDYIKFVQQLQNGGLLPIGLPSVDKVVLPQRPGNQWCVLSRPGHCKTSTLLWKARKEAQRIIDRGKVGKEVVVYVTYEQTAEELTTILQSNGSGTTEKILRGNLTDKELREVIKRGLAQVSQPIWIIGHGISRKSESMKITPEVVYRAIESMEATHGVKPILMCFDYMQLIPITGRTNRVEQVTEAPIRIKNLGNSIGCPQLLAVQASRRVDEYQYKLPEPGDSQWASSIEQTADLLTSQWIPWKTEEDARNGGKIMNVAGQQIEVTPSLVFWRLLKQRFAAGRHTWPLWFDFDALEYYEMELRDDKF